MTKLRANSFLCDLPVYQPGRPIDEVAREIGLDPSEVIKLASNENPLGPSPRAIDAMKKAATESHRYPDGTSFHLRNAVAKKHGLDPAQVVFGNGSNELIELVGHAFLKPGDEMVIAQYAFAIYEIVGKLFQAKLVEVPAKNYGHDIERMLKAITSATRVMFFANPNNPTGTACTPKELREMILAVPDHVLLVLDEAYQDFLEQPLDSAAFIRPGQKPGRDNLLILRTFSKAHGLAGLRIGYGLGPPAIAEALERVRQPFNANAMAQAAAEAALGDDAHIRRTFVQNIEGRTRLESELQRLGLDFVPSFGNFLLINVGDGQAIFERLLLKGVIVRPMGGYKLPAFIRVSVGTAAENGRFIAELSKLGVSPTKKNKS
jgi:histidinol-phosphate aminotransferase